MNREIPTFGQREEGVDYTLREAVYCVMFNNKQDKVAIIQTSNGKYFLPGGGMEANETHEDCLKREAIEELGMQIEVGNFIGCAQRYFYSTNDRKHYENVGYFYLCKHGEQVSAPLEEEHLLKWMEPNEAIKCLFHEHQSWAVKEALR